MIFKLNFSLIYTKTNLAYPSQTIPLRPTSKAKSLTKSDGEHIFVTHTVGSRRKQKVFVTHHPLTQSLLLSYHFSLQCWFIFAQELAESMVFVIVDAVEGQDQSTFSWEYSKHSLCRIPLTEIAIHFMYVLVCICGPMFWFILDLI